MKIFSAIFFLLYLVLVPAYGSLDVVSENRLSGDYSDYYPLGFSKNHLFAYLIFDQDDGSSAQISDARMLIVNLVNDKTVYDEWIVSWKDNLSLSSFKELLDKYNVKISEILKRYEIIPQGIGALQQFPLIYKSDTYQVVIEKKNSEESGLIVEGHDTYFDVVFNSEKKGSKSLAQFPIDDDPDMARYRPKYGEVGYLLSPFEERIVVFIKMSRFTGHEGAVSGYEIIGAHLNAGFTK